MNVSSLGSRQQHLFNIYIIHKGDQRHRRSCFVPSHSATCESRLIEGYIHYIKKSLREVSRSKRAGLKREMIKAWWTFCPCGMKMTSNNFDVIRWRPTSLCLLTNKAPFCIKDTVSHICGHKDLHSISSSHWKPIQRASTQRRMTSLDSMYGCSHAHPKCDPSDTLQKATNV